MVYKFSLNLIYFEHLYRNNGFSSPFCFVSEYYPRGLQGLPKSFANYPLPHSVAAAAVIELEHTIFKDKNMIVRHTCFKKVTIADIAAGLL